MTPETEAEIRNVKKFGRYARQFCMLIAVVVGLSLPLTALSILAGPRWSANSFRMHLGPYLVTSDRLTSPQLQAWSFICIASFSLVMLWGVFHLYRLFRHLEAGEIYTGENVRHIRQVGLVAIAMGVLRLVLPPLTFVLMEVGFIDRTLVAIVDAGGSGGHAPLVGGTFDLFVNGGGALLIGGAFDLFVMGALVMLASWIMDVGRETSDEAAAMRRDADLVI
jgi:hypothetical protein